jgi:ABC-type uncharacterized transport system permease subunit
MNDSDLIKILASILAQSAPLMLAITGETITERVGVINLSIDGSMLISAMAGFVVALHAGQALTSADHRRTCCAAGGMGQHATQTGSGSSGFCADSLAG